MSRFTVLVALAAAAICCVEGKRDYAARLQELQITGAALQENLKQQWTDVLDGQRQRLAALVTSLLRKQNSAETKAALTKVATKLFQNLTAVDSYADRLKREQGEEFNQLANQYVTLLRQRINATGAAATDETPILNLRKRKSTWLALWENKVSDINSQYRAAYRDVFSAASKAAACKPTVQAALRAAFVEMLDGAVVGQEENITLLTARQFSKVEEFVLHAELALQELLVAAQGAAL